MKCNVYLHYLHCGVINSAFSHNIHKTEQKTQVLVVFWIVKYLHSRRRGWNSYHIFIVRYHMKYINFGCGHIFPLLITMWKCSIFHHFWLHPRNMSVILIWKPYLGSIYTRDQGAICVPVFYKFKQFLNFKVYIERNCNFFLHTLSM